MEEKTKSEGLDEQTAKVITFVGVGGLFLVLGICLVSSSSSSSSSFPTTNDVAQVERQAERRPAAPKNTEPVNPYLTDRAQPVNMREWSDSWAESTGLATNWDWRLTKRACGLAVEHARHGKPMWSRVRLNQACLDIVRTIPGKEGDYWMRAQGPHMFWVAYVNAYEREVQTYGLGSDPNWKYQE